VDAEFSGREDFAPGQYKAEQSAAAQTMLSIINQAMQKDFARYVKPGKKVKIVIKGSADAAPIKTALTYKNEYGEFTDAPVIANGEATTLTVNKKTGIRTNEELAFLRAMGMKDSMEKGVKALKTMIATYETEVEQAEGVGGQFRRIFVDYIFEDAF
jgi:cell division protein YceG involved in septum cleavage